MGRVRYVAGTPSLLVRKTKRKRKTYASEATARAIDARPAAIRSSASA